MVHRASYERADFPMLPNLIGLNATPAYILAHVIPTVLASALAFSGAAAVIVSLSGAALLALGLILWRRPTPRWAWRFYKGSNYYLVLVFLCLLIGG